MAPSQLKETLRVSAKILIADSMDDRAIQILEEAGLTAEKKTGLSEDELCGIIREYDGLIVRSATKVTAKILDAAKGK